MTVRFYARNCVSGRRFYRFLAARSRAKAAGDSMCASCWSVQREAAVARRPAKTSACGASVMRAAAPGLPSSASVTSSKSSKFSRRLNSLKILSDAFDTPKFSPTVSAYERSCSGSNSALMSEHAPNSYTGASSAFWTRTTNLRFSEARLTKNTSPRPPNVTKSGSYGVSGISVAFSGAVPSVTSISAFF